MIEVQIVGHPPSPNRTRRQHWGQRSADTAKWRRVAYLTALQALRDSGRADDYPLTLAHVRITWVVTDNRRRDPDNVIASCKPIIDGIVDAGVIPDDSFTVIKTLEVGSVRGQWDGVTVAIWR